MVECQYFVYPGSDERQPLGRVGQKPPAFQHLLPERMAADARRYLWLSAARAHSSGTELAEWIAAATHKHNLRYVELRPFTGQGLPSTLGVGQSFWVHALDLTKAESELFKNLDKSSLQRRIRRAEHEQLEYEKGSSESLLDEFCDLLLITRRRHQLLPQPRSWFCNLAKNLKSDFVVRIARKDGKAIAAIVTLRHRHVAVYKYGCSDEQYHYLGGMPFLFWKVITECGAEGAEGLDFGRTEPENEGLLRFKDQFGTVRRKITYIRYPPKNLRILEARAISSHVPFAGHILSVLPGFFSWRLGGILYRHMG
jgi:lipid II:glycine glycyltransferase (peptidoglycan interpeptide bridge formation enzyme)